MTFVQILGIIFIGLVILTLLFGLICIIHYGNSINREYKERMKEIEEKYKEV